MEVETRNCFSAKVFRLPRCQTRIILVLPASGSRSRCSRFQAIARSLNPRKISRTYSFAKRGGKRRGNRVTYMQRRDEHTGKGGRDCDHHSRWKIDVGFARGIYSPTARNKAISPQLVNFAFVREVASWSHLIRNPPPPQPPPLCAGSTSCCRIHPTPVRLGLEQFSVRQLCRAILWLR